MIPILEGLAFLPSGFGFEMSFTVPVYAGDTLTARVEVGEVRSSSHRGRGVMRMDQTLLNQHERVVMGTPRGFG